MPPFGRIYCDILYFSYGGGMTVGLKAWKEAWKRQVRQAAEEMDLPQSVLTGLPRLVLEGNEVELQGQGGILEYSPERICVAVKGGCIRVTGSGIVLTTMEKDALRFSGRITTVELLDEGGEHAV